MVSDGLKGSDPWILSDTLGHSPTALDTLGHSHSGNFGHSQTLAYLQCNGLRRFDLTEPVWDPTGPFWNPTEPVGTLLTRSKNILSRVQEVIRKFSI